MSLGEIPGAGDGTTYPNDTATVSIGIHCQHTAVMVGGAKNGTESIVLNGGYVDDLDYGDEIIYTGFGGRDSSGCQVKDQEWIGANEGMRVNVAEGLPVRVMRGPRGGTAFDPRSGYRYDGLYTVEETWEQTGRDGFRICRFRLLKADAYEVPTTTGATPPVPPIKKATALVTRRVRDTVMTRKIKQLYDHTCQFCGTRLVLPDGRGVCGRRAHQASG